MKGSYLILLIAFLSWSSQEFKLNPLKKERSIENVPQAPESFWDLQAEDIDGNIVKFKDLKTKYKKILITNVGTYWGLTPLNYEQFQNFQKEFGPKLHVNIYLWIVYGFISLWYIF